jgi:hypothetical protein
MLRSKSESGIVRLRLPYGFTVTYPLIVVDVRANLAWPVFVPLRRWHNMGIRSDEPISGAYCAWLVLGNMEFGRPYLGPLCESQSSQRRASKSRILSIVGHQMWRRQGRTYGHERGYIAASAVVRHIDSGLVSRPAQPHTQQNDQTMQEHLRSSSDRWQTSDRNARYQKQEYSQLQQGESKAPKECGSEITNREDAK